MWKDGQMAEMPTLAQIRENVKESLRTLRQDHKRSLNPTPYKVSQSKHNFTLQIQNLFCSSNSFLRPIICWYELFCDIIGLKKVQASSWYFLYSCVNCTENTEESHFMITGGCVR